MPQGRTDFDTPRAELRCVALKQRRWRRLSAAGLLEERRAELARADLRSLPIDRVPHAPLLERCWALRTNLTVYDAAYVALAEVIDARLLTADAKLAATPGPRCTIEVLQ